MKLKYKRVIEWARTHGILDQSTAQFQMLKATEEHGEMAAAIIAGNRDELIDSIGDQLVVAIVQCAQLGYLNELEDYTDVPEYSFERFESGTNQVLQQWRNAMYLTVQQGEVAAELARNRCALCEYDNLFDRIYRLCYVYHIDPSEALDSVYDIISKRGGKMVGGVWVKSEDLQV